MREPKEGEYYYAPRGRQYAIMQRHYVGGICMDDKVECCNTRFRARERVYELNGWRKDCESIRKSKND